MFPVCHPVPVLHLRDDHLLHHQLVQYILRADECHARSVYSHPVRDVAQATKDHQTVLGRGPRKFGGRTATQAVEERGGALESNGEGVDEVTQRLILGVLF